MHNLLVPMEKPVLTGLDSYYIHHEKFIEYMREKYGSGCVHFSSSDESVLFFNKSKFLPSKVFKNNQIIEYSSLAALMEQLEDRCSIDVYALSSDAISFWSHLPASVDQKQLHVDNHRELKTTLDSFKTNHFSGYLSIINIDKTKGGILFFGQGEFLGGSYSWGKGGLDSSSEYRNKLVHLVDPDGNYTVRLGRFLYDEYQGDVQEATEVISHEYVLVDDIEEDDLENETEVDPFELSEEEIEKILAEDDQLNLANIDGYITAFHNVLSKKNDSHLLKEKFLEHLDEYPFLDPFLGNVDYSYGAFHYHGEEDEDMVVTAIIKCIGEIVQEQKMEKKFLKHVEKWSGHGLLVQKGLILRL